eukprot:m.60721 g.60721  ORF g.60721 m.60721 type:complete len:784 (+) comp7972_c0_seq1:104-2455(+)
MKQTNKAHKQRHRSKGQINKEDGGRIDDFKERRRHKPEERKADRRNQARQHRTAKRQAVAQSKRSSSIAPHIVVVVGLCGDATPSATICNTLAPGAVFDEAADSRLAKLGTVWNAALKQWVTVAPAPEGDISGVLDLARVADTIVYAVSATADITPFGTLAQSALKALGSPSIAYLINDLDEHPAGRRNDMKKAVVKAAHAENPEAKVFTLEAEKNVATVLWNIVNSKHKPLLWRDNHPYLLAQNIHFVPSDDNPEVGTLLVSGYTRGKEMNVHDLVHLPALGACKVSGVTAETDPVVSRRGDAWRPGSGTVLAAARPEQQQDLDSVVALDPLDGEQTWPTDEEIREAQANGQDEASAPPPAVPGSRLVRVPKGTSSYQAHWIVDAIDFDGENAGNDEADGSLDGDADAMNQDSEPEDAPPSAAHEPRVRFQDDVEEHPDGEYELVDADDKSADRAREYDAAMDEDEEQAALEAAREDKEFPDEVDTPQHIKAKVRFQKYRGLQSFRHSKWDPREELPEDYGRIFQFQSFLRTRKRVLSKDPGDGSAGWVASGRFVTLHVEGVPSEYFASIPQGIVFIAFGLLEHENRKSVLNFKLQMHTSYNQPIKSKERLIFYSGLRRFSSCPIFSQHTVGDKHKFERFFQPGAVCVATTYAPIHYPPTPVIVFREGGDGTVHLVATGSLLSVNPDRLIIKRIRLAGHPFKINKRTATLRYMFFNPEDIHWFKSVELTTKYGRKGHIKESLGTHGHMKCVFDGPINAQDTVLMNLYKRVYPKWTYEELGFP